MLDQGLSALLDDLEQRGLADDVSVVVWGEFGRTPQDQQERRPRPLAAVGCALLAGGGMKTGQVIGSTDRDAGAAKDRPVHFQEVFATLYHKLGIDVRTAHSPTSAAGRSTSSRTQNHWPRWCERRTWPVLNRAGCCGD